MLISLSEAERRKYMVDRYLLSTLIGTDINPYKVVEGIEIQYIYALRRISIQDLTEIVASLCNE